MRTSVGVGLVVGVAVCLSSVAAAAQRGGWPDLPWTYIYEAGPGQDAAGMLGNFDDLDGSWDSQNTFNLWFGDTISDFSYPGGIEALTRTGLGDNEGGASAADAATLGLLDLGEGQNNNSLYFERFLTDGGDTGEGNPTIDFANGLTIVARFRFFPMSTLMPNRDNMTEEPAYSLRRSLGIPAEDDGSIWAFLNPFGASMAYAGANEYDEGPREMLDAPNGMFMVSRGDVYASLGGGPGGIYFGMNVDGDDSWDPSTFTTPPPAAPPVGVKVAMIVRGPENANVPFQMSDKRIVDRLRARGITVTVLDHGHGSPLTGGHMSYTSGSLTGPAAVAADHDLIIISSTVGSGNVSNPQGYRPYNVPVIMWENGLGVPSRGYGIATDGGTVLPENRIQIQDNTHPITSGLPTGVQALFHGTKQRNISIIGYGLPPAATQLGCYPGNTSLTVLAAYDPNVGGGVMSDGGTLKSNQRYVFLPFEDDTFWAANATGMQIFDAAVEWALGPSKAALLGPRPPLPPAPPEPSLWKPSFYINLGATPLFEMGGNTMHTRVLKGRFFRDTTSADPTVPALGGDTKVWADLPSGSMSDFLSVYITVQPETNPPPGPLPAHRVKVYFNGSSTPAIEIQNHHLDPSITPAVGNSVANDGTGLGMGLWRTRAGGYLDVDYFGVKAGAVPPPTACNSPAQDVDGDGDVDLADFGTFQDCFNGPNRPYNTAGDPGKCACLDGDSDLDVDLADFGSFQSCFNGPNRPASCGS